MVWRVATVRDVIKSRDNERSSRLAHENVGKHCSHNEAVKQVELVVPMFGELLLQTPAASGLSVLGEFSVNKLLRIRAS